MSNGEVLTAPTNRAALTAAIGCVERALGVSDPNLPGNNLARAWNIVRAEAERPRTRRVWLVKETAYGRVGDEVPHMRTWGFRHFLPHELDKAEKLAATWRSQSFGTVTVEQVEVPA